MSGADLTNLPRVTLKRHEDRRLRRGHLWVFSNEIDQAPADIEAGALVAFLTGREELLGVGFYNARSLIAGRLLDRRAVTIDTPFFIQRLRRAKEFRDALFPDGAYRWVFGESDDLPGLLIDRYGDAVVLESTCAGMDRLLPQVEEAVAALGPWKTLVRRNDTDARRLEGLESEVKVLSGALDRPHWFSTEGLTIGADLLEGQKTGYFFDQRTNRNTVAALAKNRTVLDVFCHTGGFGLWAARGGASKVTGVDKSESALELARQNAEKNGLGDKMRFEASDAFDYLIKNKDTHDIVVLDPPRFAAGKKNLPQALKAYIRLNTLGLQRVRGGGFLATASCSQHVGKEEFRQILARAIHESGRRAVVVHSAQAGMDHPVRPGMPETDYLKFSLLHVG